MLKKVIGFLSPFNRNPATSEEPHILAPGQHPVTRERLSNGALKTVEILKAEGFQAFIVGGCIRDILLDLSPKDFDVATDATPEEVKALFRRARIIGRRFRIVHVYMGRELIEVTTFRAGHDGDRGNNGTQSTRGMLLRDNVYGDINEDARRRDFTVNALYYDPGNDTLYDYANGMRDIERRTVAAIGDPETRYREDPVRMLRAARFAGKLGFTIDTASSRPIDKLAVHLADVPPARLFDEVLKLFLSGYALATFNELRNHGLFDQLFPQTAECLAATDDEFYLRFIEQALVNTDKRIRNNQRVTPAFLLAAFLWPAVIGMRKQLDGEIHNPAMALQKAGGVVIARQVNRIAIPRRFSQPMREIWELQLRLPNRSGNRAAHLVEQPRFRAAYDFMLLREEAGENLDGLGYWWTRYQEADENGRRAMVEALGSGGGKKRRKRRNPRRKPRRSAPD